MVKLRLCGYDVDYKHEGLHYTGIGKHRALSREVTCNFRLYLEIGQTSVKPC